jgi:hypothetical protein
MRKSNQSTLGEAINEFLKAFKLDEKLAETKAVGAWENLMGPTVSRLTKNIYIRNRTLYVELSSAVLREELSFGKEKIKKMLNEEAGVSVIDNVVLK